MTQVRDILQGKSTDVWTIAPDEMAYRALEIMAEKNIGALVVTEGGQVVGIFSERDYARKVILKGRSSKETPVRDLMESILHSVQPDQTIEDCMTLFTDKRVRHLPVIVNGQLTGLVSIGDVVKRIISEQESTIQQLEDYIVGRR